LDVGAGIGRVTRDVLLHLVQDVVLVEPVEKYVQEAWSRAQFQENPVLDQDSIDAEDETLEEIDFRVLWKGIREQKTSVTLIQSTHQSLDPSDPLSSTKYIGRVGYKPSPNELGDINSKFDLIWCQWSLGHLSNPELVLFFTRAKSALRDSESVMIVKENVCAEIEGSMRGGMVFDDQDSSLTRYVGERS
jgi:protein N-terminal methyltransferase